VCQWHSSVRANLGLRLWCTLALPGALLALASPAGASFKFIVAGDPQIGWSDPVAEQQRLIALAHISNRMGVDFVVLEGDMTHNNTASEWSLFDYALHEFHVPVHATRGNHDGVVNWVQRFGALQYTFTADTSTFINIDSNVLAQTTPSAATDEAWAWLASTLETAAPTSDNIFLVMHHPPFVGSETEANSWVNWNTASRAQLLSLVRQYGVEDILTGHVHSNMDISPLDNSFHIITTTGSAGGLNVGTNSLLAYRLFQVDDAGAVTQRLIYDFTDPGTDPPASLILGDVNGDGTVNALDISDFVQVITGADSYKATADMNADGQVNALDISDFIGVLTGGNSGGALQIPEPCTFIVVDAGTLFFLRRQQQQPVT
jgi:hypothetical protein